MTPAAAVIDLDDYRRRRGRVVANAAGLRARESAPVHVAMPYLWMVWVPVWYWP